MSESTTEPVAPLVEHFFRHQARELVAVLTHLFGWRNSELIEDMVQATLVEALESWRTRGVPENPAAWVHRVAKNKILDVLRRDRVGNEILRNRFATSSIDTPDLNDLFLETEIEDSQLRMIFACCHPRLARENQLALTLKALCGFGNSEIARALLISDETVKKRLQRATRDLIDNNIELETPSADALSNRLDAVHQVLYLLFNEGYCSSAGDQAVREDLCEEAARLCHLLCSHPHLSVPTTFALMALMLFHGARLDARTDQAGAILLFEEQDRSRWDYRLIGKANEYLQQSAQGSIISEFHLEAAIACHHCMSPDYASTNWRAILELYDALLLIHRSPIYLLNRAIIVAEIDGPHAGIRALEETRHDPAMNRYHLYDAALGEFHRRAGNLLQAKEYFNAAKEKTDSPFDQQVLERRLASCLNTLL